MKKTYIAPDLLVVKIASVRMLSGSEQSQLFEETATPEESFSRGFDFDDEE